MKEIINTASARVFQMNEEGGLVTLAIAYNSETNEPEIVVMMSSEKGNSFLTRGVGPLILARTMCHFGGQMPTIDQVTEFNAQEGGHKIHQQVLADYTEREVLNFWDFHCKPGEKKGFVDLPNPESEKEVDAMLALLGAEVGGNA